MPYSYSQYQQRQRRLQMLLLPGWLNLVAEAAISVVLLIVVNISNIENQLLSGIPNQELMNPLTYTGHILSKLSGDLSQYRWVSHATLFLLWAALGMLAYILCFRLWHFTTTTAHTLEEGVIYARTGHMQGVRRWLGSLHDVLLKATFSVGGVVLVLIGAFLAFSYGNLELRVGLSQAYSSGVSVPSVLIGFLSAFLGIRIILIGLCLSSEHFRRWYFR